MHNLHLTIILIKTLKVKNEKLLHVSIPVGLSSRSTHIKQLCTKHYAKLFIAGRACYVSHRAVESIVECRLFSVKQMSTYVVIWHSDIG